MKIDVDRRSTLRMAAVALVAPTFTSHAQQQYPNRPVQLVVAWPPGGGTDTLARLVATYLGNELGQTVLVVNRPGASGLIGSTQVMRAAADGYTLILDTGNATLRPAIDPQTPFTPADFDPICLLTESPVALAISGSLPIDSFADLIAYTRKHPGTVNYASTGLGSPQHLVTELLKVKTGLDWTHVPYQGGAPALADLVSGRVQVMFSNPVPLLGYVRNRRLKCLAVTSASRLPALPDAPTMQEVGQPDLGIGFWNGVLAPRGTPADVRDKVSGALLKVMAQPAVQDSLVRQGSVLKPMGPQEFAAYMAKDSKLWQSVATQIHYQARSATGT